MADEREAGMQEGITINQPEDETNSPKDSVLDGRPLRVFGRSLSTKQQIWIGFLIPSTISCAIFIAGFATDMGVVHQLIRDRHPILAGFTLLFAYAPALFCLSITLLHPPSLEGVCDLITWIIIQLLHCLLFPLGIMYRYATRFFWSICALIDEDPAREEALQRASAAHQTELFLLLDGFLHAAPQALLQAYILMSKRIPTSTETSVTQGFSVLISVISLAAMIAVYQRYESQKAVGRPQPWTVEHNNGHANALVKMVKIDPTLLLEPKLKNSNNKPTIPSIEVTIGPTESNQEGQDATSTSTPTTVKIGDDDDQRTPPEMNTAPINLPKIELEPINFVLPQKPSTNEENVATSKEGQNEENSINDQSQMTPSADDAAKPKQTEEKNISATNEGNCSEEVTEESALLSKNEDVPKDNNESENSEALPSATSRPSDPEPQLLSPFNNDSPPLSPTEDHYVRPRLSFSRERDLTIPPPTPFISLPVRKPRTKGLHEDEPLGLLMAFFGYWFFILARVLVLASFAYFYPWPSLGLVLGHYITVTSYLYYCNPSCKFFPPILGFIFILCPVEITVRYKYPRLFLISFAIVVAVENIATLVLWYCGAYWEGWWYKYTCFVIVGAQLLAALHAVVYIFLFKPKPKYIY